MKKRSLKFLSKGIGYSTAVFFKTADHGTSLYKFGKHATKILDSDC